MGVLATGICVAASPLQGGEQVMVVMVVSLIYLFLAI